MAASRGPVPDIEAKPDTLLSSLHTPEGTHLMTHTVLVSGGSGYIAGFLIRQPVAECWMCARSPTCCAPGWARERTR